MALDLGTLFGTLELDQGPFQTGLSKALDSVRTWGTAGKRIAATAGVGIGIAVVGSVAKAMDLQPARNKLRAQLGLSAKDSAKVGEVAGRLFGNAYGESLGQVNDAVKAVGGNMVNLKKTSAAELEQITAKVLDVATAFDQDLNMTTAAAGQLMRTGLAKNAAEAMDIITVGLQGPANKADDLLETFNEYGTQFRKLGLDGPAALGLINQAVKAGARDSDIAADALKEFSIRAVDGSKLTASGFKDLGLNADEMARKIAKGGPAAEKALGVTLDKLRAVKDPAERSRIAVALFGTQAEDLGDALYAMDTSTAQKELGKVGGAADEMGKRLNDNAQTNITAFTRQVQTKFVDLIGNKVLPVITEASAILATQFGPAFSAAAGFMERHQTAAAGVAIGVGALVAALFAASVAARVASAAQTVWTIATKIGAAAAWLFQKNAAGARRITILWAAAQRVAAAAAVVWSVAQRVLNAAMRANPIGIVITVLALLVGALILAYRRSETFRNIVQAALRIAGRAFSWLWARAKDAFDWLKKNWGLVLAIITGPIGLAVRWVYRNWDKIKATFRAGVAWISSTFKRGWAKLTGYLMQPVDAGKTLIDNRIARVRAIFRAILNYIGTTWTRGWARIRGWMRDPVEAARKAIDKVIDGVKRIFSAGVTKVGEIWARLKDKAKKPISFIINTVLNNGLRKAWNWVANKVGLSPIDPIVIKGFRTGGPTGPGADHEIAGVVHGNEHVATADEVRKAGGHGTWERIRAAARAGLLKGFFLGGRAPIGGGWNRHNSGYGFARWAGDNPAPTGTPVRAWRAGVTAQANRWNHSYGRHVWVNHPGGVRSLYAHLSAILTRVGEKISAGELIGLVGSTGNSTGPHLHFELRGGSAALGKDTGLLTRVIDYAAKFKDRLAGPFGRLKELGSSPWAQLVKAAALKIKDAAVDKVTNASPLGGYGNGVGSAWPGIAGVAENGAELVVNPQLRRFRGGETVYDSKQTKKMLGGLGAGSIQQTNYFPSTMSPEVAAEAAGGRLAATLKANGW